MNTIVVKIRLKTPCCSDNSNVQELWMLFKTENMNNNKNYGPIVPF